MLKGVLSYKFIKSNSYGFRASTLLDKLRQKNPLQNFAYTPTPLTSIHDRSTTSLFPDTTCTEQSPLRPCRIRNLTHDPPLLHQVSNSLTPPPTMPLLLQRYIRLIMEFEEIIRFGLAWVGGLSPHQHLHTQRSHFHFHYICLRYVWYTEWGGIQVVV